MISRSLTYLTPRRIWNIAAVLASYGLSVLLRKPVVWGMPVSYSVEPTNYCNFSCPECPSGTGALTRPRGKMDLSFYKRFIDEIAPAAHYLQLFLQGEPFLHKEIAKMTAYARLKKMYVSISTNGSVITEKNIDVLFSPPPDKLIFSIDGLDEVTYAVYRSGGTFKEAERGLNLVLERRKREGSKRPFVELQFIVMKHNEHQMDDMKEYGRTIGADAVVFKSMQVSSIESAKLFLPENEKYRRYRIEDGELRIKSSLPNRCFALWRTGVITWDGKAVPCCFDKDAEFVLGDLTESGFADVWKNEAYLQFRKQILTGRKNIPICRNCTEGLQLKMTDY